PPVLRGPHPAHSPPRSREEALRRKMEGNNGRRPRVVSNSRSPQRRAERRPRRNSESSVLDIEKPLTEEEKKAREARRRERERRHRENKEKKPNRRLDIIDQLDHTSLFGSGFHHDGPFDAVNPHRNRKGSRRAPMQAFPKDSLNMSLGGSGPLNKTADHSTFMGMANDEAFKEYAGGAKNGLGYTSKEAPVFDPRMRTAMHGEESLGLGTSTFLEGTPAPRTAIQKQVAEQAEQMASEGLQRKKSLAQRIRNINRPQRDVGPSGRLTNPEGVYARTSPDFVPSSTSTPQYSTERNPFFNEDHKEPESHMLHRAHTGTMSPTSPPPRPASQQGVPLERRVTSDATSPTEDGSGRQSGGFLSRVKSLKGGRRNRQSSDNLAPGTAV
ncbi:Pal1-domain-containing protein, partial [Sodiomyces alkalinus F11]